MLACASSDGRVSILQHQPNDEWHTTFIQDSKLGCNSVSWAPFNSLGSREGEKVYMRLVTGSCDNRVRFWRWVGVVAGWLVGILPVDKSWVIPRGPLACVDSLVYTSAVSQQWTVCVHVLEMCGLLRVPLSPLSRSGRCRVAFASASATFVRAKQTTVLGDSTNTTHCMSLFDTKCTCPFMLDSKVHQEKEGGLESAHPGAIFRLAVAKEKSKPNGY